MYIAYWCGGAARFARGGRFGHRRPISFVLDRDDGRPAAPPAAPSATAAAPPHAPPPVCGGAERVWAGGGRAARSRRGGLSGDPCGCPWPWRPAVVVPVAVPHASRARHAPVLGGGYGRFGDGQGVRCGRLWGREAGLATDVVTRVAIRWESRRPWRSVGSLPPWP